ncbi:MAG: hypothetical protein LBK23_05955 [Oscillospiraceae bacterium]|jgi:hypothetical protein|nr:hypothetical protein [Oscillospiraceae bacterium]
MATSTFDKRIIIDDAAADVLIELLKEPAPPRPDASKIYRELTKEDIECCLRNRSARLLKQNSRKP